VQTADTRRYEDKHTFAERLARRPLLARLGTVEHGLHQNKSAEALGVMEEAVSQWITKGKVQGPETLRHQPLPGAPLKLTPEQRAQLPELLAQGAEAFGFRRRVWTAR
jgi:transposase